MFNHEILREKMIAASRELPDNCALMLSGGLDSGLLLASARAAGKSFSIYTVSFGEFPNTDNILAARRARLIAPDAPFERICCPRNERYAKETVEWVIKRSGGVCKTAIECCMMMIHAIDVVSRKHPAIATTMSGGVLWGLGKEARFEYSRTGDEGWTNLRRVDVAWEKKGFPPNATRVCRDYCEELNVQWCDPMFELSDWMLSLKFKELNLNLNKKMATLAFPELGLTKHEQGGLQVIAGVREYMQIVAKQLGFPTPLKWYADVARSLGFKPKGDEKMRALWSTK